MRIISTSEGYKEIDDQVRDVIGDQYTGFEFSLGCWVLERNAEYGLRLCKSLSRVGAASYSTEYELKGHS